MHNFNDETLIKLFSYFSISEFNTLKLVSKQWNVIAKAAESLVHSKLSSPHNNQQVRRRKRNHHITEEPIDDNHEASFTIQQEFPYTSASETTPLLKLTAKSQQFLTALDLTASDLQIVGIQLNEIERILNQPKFAKTLTFFLGLISLTFVRKLTYSLFLSESAVTEKIQHNQRKCTPAKPLWLQGEGIPLAVKTAIRKAYGIEGFYEGLELFEKVWKGFLTYLIINDLVLTLQNHCAIDALTILNNVFIRYEDVLGASLARTTVWPFLVGIPLLTGAYYAYQEQKHAKHLNTRAIRKTMKQLLAHKTNGWNDTGRWLFSPFSFEIFPYLGVNVVFALLPYPRIKEKLDSVIRTLRWNARIPMATQLELFEVFREFAHRSNAITHWESLNILAQIAASLGKHDLSRLQRLGVSQDEIIALLTIKTEALRELRYFAHFSLRKSLVSFVYAHYLLWRQGQSQTTILQPLFFIYEGVKVYFMYALFKAIYDNIYGAISHHIAQIACESEGKKWLYIEQTDRFECSLCGDLPLFYNDIFTSEDCIRGFLNQPWSLDDLLAFANDKRYNFSAINSLNLSRQVLAPGELSFLLKALCPKISNLQELLLDLPSSFWHGDEVDNVYIRNKSDMLALKDCLTTLPITFLNLDANYVIDGISDLSSGLASSSVEKLSWNNAKLDAHDIEQLTYGLSASPISHLYLANNRIENDGVDEIGYILNQANISTLDLSNNCQSLDIGSQGLCWETLASYLPTSSLHVLKTSNLDLTYSSNTSYIMAQAIAQTPTLKSFTDNFCFTQISKEQAYEIVSILQHSALQDLDVGLNYAQLLVSALSSTQLERISLDDNSYISSEPEYINSTVFTQVLLNSSITDFSLFNFNLTNTISQAAASLTKSKITTLNLAVGNHYNKEDELVLLQALPNMLINKFTFYVKHTESIELLAQNLSINSPLKVLYLLVNEFNRTHFLPLFEKFKQSQIETFYLQCFKVGTCHMGAEDMQDLAKNLPESNIKDLALPGFQINDVAIKELASVLTTASSCNVKNPLANYDPMLHKELAKSMPRTNLTTLTLVFNNITDSGAAVLCNVLPQTKIAIQNLDLTYNQLDQIDPTNCRTRRPILYPSAANRNHPFGYAKVLANFYNFALHSTNNFYQRLSDYLRKPQTKNIKSSLIDTGMLESNEISAVNNIKTATSNKAESFYKNTNKFLFFNAVGGAAFSNITATSLLPSPQSENNNNFYQPLETNSWLFIFLAAGSALIVVSLILLVDYLGQSKIEHTKICHPRCK